MNIVKEIKKAVHKDYMIERLISEAIKKSDEWLVITDDKADIIFANDFACSTTGYCKDEIIGQNPRVLKSGYQDGAFYEKLWGTLVSNQIFSSIFANRKKSGEIFYVKMKIIPITLGDNQKRYISIGREVTREIELTSEIEKIKFHDILTGLLNFNAFSFKTSEAIGKTKKPCILFLVDINNLTYINQVYGLAAGDDLLKKAGELLSNSFKETDVIAKIGGDEFGVLLKDIRRKENAFVVKDKLSATFNIPMEIDGKCIPVGINAGAALYPDDGTDFKILYERASIALSNAKKGGVGTIEFFNPLMEEKALIFVKTENLIDRAIKENLFIFHYQPYFKTDDLSVGGFESLVRLKDDKGRIYSPAAFIDYLENSIYLEPFENFALETIVQKIKTWNTNISLNISAKSFKRESFYEKLINACYKVGSSLTIEITERVLVEDIEKAQRLIKTLKNCGNEFGDKNACENPIRIAMDDFGSGYSSLFILKDLPINILKIDISFIRDITKGPRELALVRAIVELARELGLETVAEGVETEKQLELLKQLKCDYVQGFLLARPIPEEEIPDFLSKHKN